ncbi:uncharacterized protein LOC129612487, partial [Condylostylus longicornis]|uniref:uncharacterized protein LOC129612487 n=1 Tax=Condylostylus longicornis TaxID=2530218 RepID=UPI00244DF96F
MKYFSVVLSVSFKTIIFLTVVRSDDELALDFAPCNENNLDECFKDIMQNQLIANKDGSEILGIPPLDPLEIQKQRVDYNGQNGIEVGMLLENVKIHGLCESKIKNVQTSLDEIGLNVTSDVYTPKLQVTGNYKANIKMNDLKIRPKGEFNIIINDADNVQTVISEFDILNNTKILNIKNITMDANVGQIIFNATGIFPDPALNEFAVQLINRNLPNFYKLIIQESQFIWEPLIINASN